MLKFSKQIRRRAIPLLLSVSMVFGGPGLSSPMVRAAQTDGVEAIAQAEEDGYSKIGKIAAIESNKNQINITFETTEKMRITFLTDDIFRINMEMDGNDYLANPVPNDPKHAATILEKPVDSYQGVVPKLEKTEQDYIISTPKMKLTINKADSIMKLEDADGNVLWEESKPLAYNDRETIQTLKTDSDEYFYGGGQQNGYFSHKGKRINIVNENKWANGNVSSPSPFYLSTKGYGVMRHTFKPGYYDFGKTSTNEVIAEHQEKRFDAFYFVGGTMPNVLNLYTDITGKPLLMPEWGFYLGHLNAYNRDWVNDEGEQIDKSDPTGHREQLNVEGQAVLNKYIDNDMPLGWFLPNDGYGAGYGQSDTLDGNIANLKEFTKYCNEQGTQTGLWTQQNIQPVDENNPKPDDRDIDLEVGTAGVRGVKTDVAWVGAGYSFALDAVKQASEGIETNSSGRAFVVSLDGWAGTQRYAGLWSGDQTGGNWEYIRFHIPTYIGAGLSGNPNLGSDMDGIFGGKNPDVLARDYQWKAFTPIMMDMDGWGSNRKWPWILGEPAASINRTYLKLKSQMMPYTYSLAKEAHDTGMPMVRGMVLEYPNDTVCMGTQTQYQYMYGPNLLVAPVYSEQDNKDELRREIYLPDSDQVWIDYFTGKQYQGGGVLDELDAPLWKLPLFVKNGAIIPMTIPNDSPSKTAQNEKVTNLTGEEARIFDVYPSGSTSFSMYEDDGYKQDFKKGNAYATTEITSVAPVKGSGTAVITVQPTKMANNAAYDTIGKAFNRGTEFIVNVQKKPSDISAVLNTSKVDLKEVFSQEEFDKESGNVYFYNEKPNLNTFATKGSDFEKQEIITTPKLYVKIEKADVTKTMVQLTVEGFTNTQKNADDSIVVPQIPTNLAEVSKTFDSIDVKWDAIADANGTIIDNGEYLDNAEIQAVYGDKEGTTASYQVLKKGLNSLDLSKGDTLTAWVKGDSSQNNLVFSITDKNDKIWTVEYKLDSSEAKEVSFSYDNFTCKDSGAVQDFSQVKDFSIGIKTVDGAKAKKGTIWIDNIGVGLSHGAVTYELRINGEKGMIIKDLKVPAFHHANLEMDTAYTYEVRAVNSKGASEWSSIVTIKTDLDPYRNVPKFVDIKAVDKNGKTVEDHEGEEIKFAIDGDDSTTWHSQWQVAVAFPAEVVMDLGYAYSLEKFEYTPRIDKGTNGVIKKGSIQFSQDGIHWTLKQDFEWAVDSTLKKIDTPNAYARYIKLTVTEAAGDFISAGEFRSYKVNGTVGAPVGDTLASEGELDYDDFAEYKKLYAGIDKDSTLWYQVNKGDLNYNKYIDAFDVAYIARELGLETPSEEKVNGQITLQYPDSVAEGQKFEVKVMGTALNDVYAFDVAIPFDKNKIEVGKDEDTFKKTNLTANMENISKKLPAGADATRLSVFFTSIGSPDEATDAGLTAKETVHLASIHLTAKVEMTKTELETALKPSHGWLAGTDLTEKEALTAPSTEGTEEPTKPYVPKRIKVISQTCFIKDQNKYVELPGNLSAATDKDDSSFWETSYSGEYNGAFPVELILDLKQVYKMDRFEYIPRGSANGSIETVDISYSTDNTNWSNAGKNLTWDASGKKTSVYKFADEIEARYIKLHIIKTGGNGGNVAGLEFKPYVRPANYVPEEPETPTAYVPDGTAIIKTQYDSGNGVYADLPILGDATLATNKKDDDATPWETSYAQEYNKKFPVTIDLDLGAKYTMDRFEYVPRGSSNGAIKNLDIYYSIDNSNWSKANTEQLVWDAEGKINSTYNFTNGIEAQYIRLYVIETGGNGGNVTANEFKPFVKPDTSVATPAAIQVNVPKDTQDTQDMNNLNAELGTGIKLLSMENAEEQTISIALDSETKFGGDYSIRIDYSFGAGAEPEIPTGNEPWFVPEEVVNVTPDGGDWNKVTDVIKKAKEGAKVVVDATKNAQVTGAVLSAIQGKNVDLVLKINDKFTWSINGKNVEKNITGTDILDLQVAEINEKALTSAAAKQLGVSKNNVMQFEISHNGKLPFAGKLSIFVGKDKAGKQMFLNYYDEKVKAFAEKDKNVVDKDGNVVLNFDHASQYILTTESLAPVSVLVSKTVYKGSKYTLKPINLADDAAVTFTTSSKSIATVSKSGTIKGIKEGKATITTVVTQDGTEYIYKTTVTVKKPSITLEKKKASLKIGEKFQFKAKLNGITGTVTWSASNKEVAVISKNGTLKGIKSGTVTIKAKVGAISVQYKVKIVK